MVEGEGFAKLRAIVDSSRRTLILVTDFGATDEVEDTLLGHEKEKEPPGKQIQLEHLKHETSLKFIC